MPVVIVTPEPQTLWHCVRPLIVRATVCKSSGIGPFVEVRPHPVAVTAVPSAGSLPDAGSVTGLTVGPNVMGEAS